MNGEDDVLGEVFLLNERVPEQKGVRVLQVHPSNRQMTPEPITHLT